MVPGSSFPLLHTVGLLSVCTAEVWNPDEAAFSMPTGFWKAKHTFSEVKQAFSKPNRHFPEAKQAFSEPNRRFKKS
jgi:hypothetical protein